METSSRAAQQLSGQCFQDVTSVPLELRVKLPAACSAAVTPPAACRANPAGMYSPIQRLVDLAKGGCVPFGHVAAVSCVLDTDASHATRLCHSLPFTTTCRADTPFNDQDDDVGLSLREAEHIGESAGAAGDEYRFRCARSPPLRCSRLHARCVALAYASTSRYALTATRALSGTTASCRRRRATRPLRACTLRTEAAGSIGSTSGARTSTTMVPSARSPSPVRSSLRSRSRAAAPRRSRCVCRRRFSRVNTVLQLPRLQCTRTRDTSDTVAVWLRCVRGGGASAASDRARVCARTFVPALAADCRAADCRRALLQVVDGMTVSNLKDKLWNITGLAPLRQRLILPNGAELSDAMDFVNCGLQPGDSLALRVG